MAASRQMTLALTLALGLLLVAQPAAAQYGSGYGSYGTYGRRLLTVEDFKAAGVSPLFQADGSSPVLPSRRHLLQYGGYGVGSYGYGRRLLSVGNDNDDSTTGTSRPGRSLQQYGGGYGYGFYG